MFPEIHFETFDLRMYTAINNSVLYIAVIYNWLMLIKEKYELGVWSSSLRTSRLAYKFKIAKFLRSEWLYSIIEIFILTFLLLMPLLFMNSLFGNIAESGRKSYFGSLYTFPFFFLPLSMALGVEPIRTFDRLTPTYALAQTVVRLACFCGGCCNGIAWKYGLYNYDCDEVQFPSQLLESLCTLIIFFFLIKYKKKAKPGTVFPVYMISYGTLKFFCDFLKDDPKIIGVFKIGHLLSVIAVILGTVELFLARKFGEKLSLWCSEKLVLYKQFVQKYIITVYDPQNKRNKKSKKLRRFIRDYIIKDKQPPKKKKKKKKKKKSR